VLIFLQSQTVKLCEIITVVKISGLALAKATIETERRAKRAEFIVV
jgi:hypothetical protein